MACLRTQTPSRVHVGSCAPRSVRGAPARSEKQLQTPSLLFPGCLPLLSEPLQGSGTCRVRQTHLRLLSEAPPWGFWHLEPSTPEGSPVQPGWSQGWPPNTPIRLPFTWPDPCCLTCRPHTALQLVPCVSCPPSSLRVPEWSPALSLSLPGVWKYGSHTRVSAQVLLAGALWAWGPVFGG